MTRTISASGIDWGVLAAAGVLTIIQELSSVWLWHLTKFTLGGSLDLDGLDQPTAIFLCRSRWAYVCLPFLNHQTNR